MSEEKFKPIIHKELVIDGKTIVIREPGDPEEYKKLMDVQIEIWGMPGYIEAVTYHMMISGHRHGGLVLGAFEKNSGRPVGLVFSIPAYRDGQVYMYSHLAGVIPEYRYKGIGYEMKLVQRKVAIEKGYNLVVWTYDPMQSSNAYFNITKLGVIVRRFYPNYYGELTDSINRGMPSDRFEAEWWIRSRRVGLALQGKLKPPHVKELIDLGGVLVNKVVLRNNVPVMIDHIETAEPEMVLIEIPGSLDGVRRAGLLLEWRFKLRKVFDYYLNKMGYIVVGFTTHVEGGVRRSYYILWRRNIDRILDGEVPWS